MPKDSTSPIPTVYIKYSETVPKSEDDDAQVETDDKQIAYQGSDSIFNAGVFSSGKFVTPQNFEIPQEFRKFLSKPPSWINMENW